jgi:hypothetical protein
LTEHKTSREEIADLLLVVDRDIASSQTVGLIADWRLNIAYNAVLQLAVAALAAAGFRASRESHHYRVLQSLAFTVGTDVKVIARLDAFRKKRNIGGYERAGMVSDREADDLLTLAQDLRAEVVDWLRANHAELVR